MRSLHYAWEMHVLNMADKKDSWASIVKRDDVLLAEPRVNTKRPPFYQVLLLNDDYTPMDFVVYVLKTLFHKPEEEAVRIMLDVHQNGAGVCGIYTREVAETKVEQVLSCARQNEHPLQCVMEKHDE